MSLSHLNSDQRQYFWMSLLLVGAFAYFALKIKGLYRMLAFAIIVVNGVCAFSIYRRWRHAHWIYLLGCLILIGWATMRFFAKGYTTQNMTMLIGGLLSATGFYWLRKAMMEEELDEKMEEDDSMDLFELPKEHEEHVNSLIAAYGRSFGDPQWVHHLIPKPLWLHRYADCIVTIPPTETRPTWLYGTLLISALSESPVELILERPEEDTIGAIGTLSQLTQYFIDFSPLEEWHTMGTHPFFGAESSVRGLLFCKPPQMLADAFTLATGEISIRYVAGITEEQLATAQAADEELGDLAGVKALHATLRIAESGIANLPQ